MNNLEYQFRSRQSDALLYRWSLIVSGSLFVVALVGWAFAGITIFWAVLSGILAAMFLVFYANADRETETLRECLVELESKERRKKTPVGFLRWLEEDGRLLEETVAAHGVHETTLKNLQAGGHITRDRARVDLTPVGRQYLARLDGRRSDSQRVTA